MGNMQLRELPPTRRWDEVIGLIIDGANAAAVAAATLDASGKDILEAASDDPGLVYSTWLLSQVARAARNDDFLQALRSLGMRLPDAPGFSDLIRAFSEKVDDHLLSAGGRSDIGEMAQLSAVSCLTGLVSQHADSLFGLETAAMQDGVRHFSTSHGFGVLAREFFATFINRYLAYFLSRELPNHVGSARRFTRPADHEDFKRALEHHARDVTSRVEDLAGRWLSAATYKLGELSPRHARWFIRKAIEKVAEDIERGRRR